MLSFRELMDSIHLLEAKHHLTSVNSSEEEISKVLKNPTLLASKNDGDMLTVGAAIKHMHPEKHPNIFHDTMGEMAKHGTAYYRATVASHPHTSDEVLHHLANDPRERVSRQAKANLAKRSGEAPAEAPAAKEKPAAAPIQKKKLPTEVPAAKEKPAAAPAPAAKVSKSKITTEEGDTSDFPYSTKVTHVLKGGKKFGTVVSGSIPSEVGQDRPFNTSHLGDIDKTGLTPHGEHESHTHGVLALVNKAKGK